MNPKQNSTTNGRPSAIANSSKWSGRTPLLPKVAASPASGASPPVQKGTPLGVGDSARDNTTAMDTPVKAFLSSNITPRSGSRKARVESASSTPNGTPSGTPSNSRPSSMIYQQERDTGSTHEALGLSRKGSNATRPTRSPSIISSDQYGPATHFRPISRDRSIRSARTTSPESNPKFFRADDARPSLASIPSERLIEQDQLNGFTRAETDDFGASRSAISTSPPPEEPRPKFFNADDAVGAKSSPKLVTGPITKSSCRAQTAVSSNGSSIQHQRATSPLKDEILSRKSSLSKATPRRHTRLVSNPLVAQEQEIRSPQSISASQSGLSRRSSLNLPGTPRTVRIRSSSVSMVESPPTRRRSVTLSDCAPMNSPKSGPTGRAEISPAPRAEPYPDFYPTSSPLVDAPKLPNIAKPAGGPSKLEQMNELAANARRERKVLDLEISNSSLLAINRTLEREMRKQNAELRRFRRLSRSGRLSIAPSSRSASKTLSVKSGRDTYATDSDDLSGRSSPISSTKGDDSSDEGGDDDDAAASDLSSFAPPDSLFPSHSARLRAKESKRLHLDLARHRALLVDSQKLNESLKRCLGRTSDLIADAKKALAYQVHLEGVEKRGGRVLLPHELNEEEVGEQRQGLLSPGIDEKRLMSWETDLAHAHADDDVDVGSSTNKDEDKDKSDSLHPLENSSSHEDEDKDSSEPLHQTETSRPPAAQPASLDLLSDIDPLSSDNEPSPLPYHTTSTSGVQKLQEYFSSLGPSWGL